MSKPLRSYPESQLKSIVMNRMKQSVNGDKGNGCCSAIDYARKHDPALWLAYLSNK